jgi:predicted nucleic acid-binding Zn ribbon protein
MRHASSTLKKIFADTLRREGGDNAPLLAWPLVCGSATAAKTNALSYAEGVLTIEVSDATWRQQLQSFERQYLAALKQISAQPVNAIKFVVRNQTARRSR